MSDNLVSWVAVFIGIVTTGAAFWSVVIAKQSLKEEAARRREEQNQQALDMSFRLSVELDRDYFQDPYVIHYRRGAATGLLKEEYTLELQNLMDFLERVAEAVNRDALEKEMGLNGFGGRLTRYWTAAKPLVDQERVRMNNPFLWMEIEKVYWQFLKMNAALLSSTVEEVTPKKDVIDRFLKNEASLPITVEAVPEAIKASLV